MAKTLQKTTGKATKKLASNITKLDPENPLPLDHTTYSYSYLNRQPYIPFFSDNNSFPKLLREIRLLSPTNDGCISRKKRYCAGIGFQDIDGADLPKEFLQWTRSVNRKNKSLNRVNQNIFESHFTYGNTPIEIVRFEVRGKRYFHVEVHNILEWRLGKADQYGDVKYAIQSPLFKENNLLPNLEKQTRRLPIYNPLYTNKENWYKDEKGVERTLIWYSNEVMGVDYYGLPSYVSALIFAQLEYKGARYNLDNFDNNMVVASILTLKGNVSEEEGRKVAKQVVNTHTGDGKRGRTIVISSEEGLEGSQLDSLETHKEGSYLDADDSWTQKLVMAHEWDSTLLGLQVSSTLGKGSGFLTKILEHVLNTTIEPAQQDCFDEVWYHILSIGNEWMKWGLNIENMEFKNKVDISGLTDVDITPAVQINEVRKAKGLPEDPKREGEYMKPTNQKSNYEENQQK